jgi:hypothetical protein
VSNLPLPADRRHLRVSDADRDQVAEVLKEAAGQGRLTLDELDQRLDQAYAAKTYADLETVTRDLPAVGASPPAPTAVGGYPDPRIGGTPGSKISIAVMSEARRSGPWVVPSTYVAFAFMGGVVLDLRQARFSEREVTIQAYSWMGGVNIIVPEDIEVDVSGIAFMGGFDHRASGPGAPGAPRVKVIGFAFMGGVDVRRKGPKKRDKNGPGDLMGGGSPPPLDR